MSEPRYTSAAHKDLRGILNDIAANNPDTALAWIERIEAKCSLIAKNPGLGNRDLGKVVMTCVVARYVIFYREGTDGVEILRVIAGDRDITEL